MLMLLAAALTFSNMPACTGRLEQHVNRIPSDLKLLPSHALPCKLKLLTDM